MTTYKVTLDSFVVTKGPRDKSWSAECVVSGDDVSPEMAQRIFDYGLKQVMADAASQATSATEAEAAMEKKLQAIRDGKWTSRGSGDGADEFTIVMRQVVRAAVKEHFGSKSPEWATFTGLDDGEQNEKLAANFAANETVFRPVIEARIAERAADRERKRGLKSAVTISL